MNSTTLKTLGMLLTASMAFTTSCQTQAGLVNLGLTITEDIRIKVILNQQLNILREIYAKVNLTRKTSTNHRGYGTCYLYNNAELPYPLTQPLSYAAEVNENGEFISGTLSFTPGAGSKATHRIFDYGMGSTSKQEVLDLYNDIQITKCFTTVFTFHDINSVLLADGSTKISPNTSLPERLAERSAIYEPILNKSGTPESLDFVIGYVTGKNRMSDKKQQSYETWQSAGLDADMITAINIDNNGSETQSNSIKGALTLSQVNNRTALDANAPPIWYCANPTLSGNENTRLVAESAADADKAHSSIYIDRSTMC